MFEGFGGPVQMNKADLSGIDPTLEACCQREIEENRKQNALEATLRRHDRIALAERRRRNVSNELSFGSGCRCCYDPNEDGGEYPALVALRSKQSNDGDQVEPDKTEDVRKEHDSDSDSDDSEFDYLLDEELPSSSASGLQSYEQERMEELQLNAMIHESAIQHGFGVHRQLHSKRVLHAAGLGMGGVKGNRAAAIPPAAVIHLYDPESEMSASLDLCLESLGETYKGTKYIRSSGRGTLIMNEVLIQETFPNGKLSLESDIPALIAVRDGVVVAVCPKLSALGDERIGRVESHAVEHWLDNARVLLREVPLEFEDYCRIRPEEDALLENMMREKAKLEEMKETIYDCGLEGCNKSFHHTHVGLKNMKYCGLVVDEDTAIGRPSA